MLPSLNSVKPDSRATQAADTVARTAWGEARGEGEDGMAAVINVVMNRVARQKGYFGLNPIAVCKKPSQFSCWLHSDVNLPKLMVVNDNDPQFAAAQRLAALALAGELPDITGGATFYFTDSIEPPSWAAKMTFIKQIGHHLFYKDAA